MRPRVGAEPFPGSRPSEGAGKEQRKRLGLGPLSLGSCRAVPQRSRRGGTTWRRPPTPAPRPPPHPRPRKDTRRGAGGGVLAAARRLRRPRAHSCQFACGARGRTGAARLRVAERAGALSLAGRLACGRLLGMGGR